MIEEGNRTVHWFGACSAFWQSACAAVHVGMRYDVSAFVLCFMWGLESIIQISKVESWLGSKKIASIVGVQIRITS